MLNRIADGVLAAVLPHREAAAPCLTTNQRCYCTGGLVYYRRCTGCTKETWRCTGCTIIGDSC